MAFLLAGVAVLGGAGSYWWWQGNELPPPAPQPVPIIKTTPTVTTDEFLAELQREQEARRARLLANSLRMTGTPITRSTSPVLPPFQRELLQKLQELQIPIM